MRIVVLGATGNLGTALVRRLQGSEHEVVAIARRVPRHHADGDVTWRQVDIATDELVAEFDGADAVVHLAWLVQPSRDLASQWTVNVDATQRVLRAVGDAGVRTLVVASSVGAYSPGPDPQALVDEDWPTHGVATSAYARQKAYLERMLDAFACATPGTRVVRMRPALIFQLGAASEQRRLFGGALVPSGLIRPQWIGVVPHLTRVRFQAVHADDVAEAITLALTSDEHGAFNLAGDGILSTADIADLLDARPVPVPFELARAAAAVTWRMRLHPLPEGWLDLAIRSPLMDTTRARQALGWTPSHTGRQALATVLEGMAGGTGAATPTLRPDREERDVVAELRTGQGARYADDPRVEEPDRLGPTR